MSGDKGFLDMPLESARNTNESGGIGFGPVFNCKYVDKEGKVIFESNIMASSEDAAKVKFRHHRMGYSDRSCKVVITELSKGGEQ